MGAVNPVSSDQVSAVYRVRQHRNFRRVWVNGGRDVIRLNHVKVAPDLLGAHTLLPEDLPRVAFHGHRVNGCVPLRRLIRGPEKAVFGRVFKSGHVTISVPLARCVAVNVRIFGRRLIRGLRDVTVHSQLNHITVSYRQREIRGITKVCFPSMDLYIIKKIKWAIVNANDQCVILGYGCPKGIPVTGNSFPML